MFSSSGDILNLVLSVCLIILTVFLCLAVYYLISGLQKIHNLIKRVESGVAKADEFLDLAQDKLKNTSTYFMMLGEIAKKAIEFVRDKKDKKTATKKK